MIKAIVYVSSTGFTRKYAELLGKELGVSVYELSDQNTPLSKGDEIIFFGWVMASSIKGFKKAQKKYSVFAICVSGMTPPHDGLVENLASKNNTGQTPLFYAQGGYDHSKQKGLHKFLMNMMLKSLNNPARMKMSEEQAHAMRDMIQNGLDCVSTKNIADVIAFAKKSV